MPDSSGPEAEKRKLRAQRILDAAATLFLRYGYARTTLDEIAREAGVGRGTLYLHWKTRDALLTALVTREKVAMGEDIKQRIAGDPAGATLGALLKHSALALMQRPLLKAVMLRDPEVLGKMVEREASNSATVELLAGFTAYLQDLRTQGLVRTDLSLHQLAAIFSSIFVGFFLSLPLLPEAFRPSEVELAELMAETGHRALEPRSQMESEALQTASHSLTSYLDRSLASAQERLQGDAQALAEQDTAQIASSPRPRGRKGGRSRKLSSAAKVAEVRRMHADQTLSIEQICAALDISRASFYRYLKDSGQEEA